MKIIILFLTMILYPFIVHATSQIELSSTAINIGIGTTVPSFPFEVKGGVIGSSGIQTPSSTARINATSGFNVNPNHGLVDTFRVDTGGNVGIGSLLPGKTLDVVGTIRTTNFTLTSAATGCLTSTSGVISSTGSSCGGAGSQTPWSSDINAASFKLYSTGNIGVGSASPGQALDVVGTIRSSQIIDNGLTASTLVTADANKSLAAATATNIVSLFSGCSGTQYLGADNACHASGGSASAAGGKNAVQYNSGSSTFAGAENIFSFNGTNIGIGTTNGNNLLDVRGTVTINSFEVNTNGNIGIGTFDSTNYLNVGSSSGFQIGSNGNINKLGGTSSSTLSGSVWNLSAASSQGVIKNNSSGSTAGMTYEGSTATNGNISMRTTTGIGASDFFQVQMGNNGAFVPFYIIDTNGSSANIGIGSTNPGSTLDVQGTIRIFQNIFQPGITSDSGKTDASICEDTTNHQFFSGSGTLGVCLGTSSARYKHDINSLDLGLSEINRLKPVKFFYKSGYGDNGVKLQYGLLAEDVVNVIPNLVALDANNNPNSVDLLGMVPILINSVQRLQLEILILSILFIISIIFILFKNKKGVL